MLFLCRRIHKHTIYGSIFIDFINTIFYKLTFPKSFNSGDPLLDDPRWGDPLFDRDAKFLIKLKGEPDLRRLADAVDDDLFMAIGVTLLPSAVIFSFSIFVIQYSLPYKMLYESFSQLF